MVKEWVHGIGHSPVCQILLQVVVRALYLLGPVLLGCCRLQLTSLSSMNVLQPPILCEGWGGHPLRLSGNSSILMDLHWPCSCTAHSSILSIGSVSVDFCEAFSWTILYSSCFPLFRSGQVFHQLVCPLTVVLPQIFCNLTTLFSNPVFFSLFHAPLDVVVHFLVFLRSFRLKIFSFSVLSFCGTILHKLHIVV